MSRLPPLRLVFIGPPGSGKGTQAQRLRPRGFLHLSTGDLLRAEIASGSERGRQLAPLLQRGELVADEIVLELVRRFLDAHAAEPVVLDGFPRNLSQARLLGRAPVHGAVFFRVPDDLVLRRLTTRLLGSDGTIYDAIGNPPPRGVTVTRRPDDEPAVQPVRLARYREHERALWEFYAAEGRAFSVPGDRSREDVHREVMRIVRRLAERLDTFAAGPQ